MPNTAERYAEHYPVPLGSSDIAELMGSLRIQEPSRTTLTLASTNGGVSIVSVEAESFPFAATLALRSLADRLCIEHPAISTDPGIFGGNPHVKGVRLTVANILAKLYIYGNIQAVAEIYQPHVGEHQIKEAIAYAQDFLEAAIHSHEASKADG